MSLTVVKEHSSAEAWRAFERSGSVFAYLEYSDSVHRTEEASISIRREADSCSSKHRELF